MQETQFCEGTEDSDSPKQKNGSPNGQTPAVGLEEALELTGYGRFNYTLLIGVWLGLSTQNLTSSDIAYAMPAAQCDLQLTSMFKGWINAGLYSGMMVTAFVWGALSDWLGRKWLLMLAFFSMAVCSTMTAFVTSAWALLLCRVVAGMLLIAPASLMLTYGAEMFNPLYRSRMFLWAGSLQAVSGALHAGLATWIIPLHLRWMRSWRVFLLVTAVANTAAGLFMLLLPESPKYLASRGRERESMAVLETIYATNTGKPADSYPVKVLNTRSLKTAESKNPFVNIAHQFMKLCRAPYRTPLLFVLSVQPLILLSQNTVRMWVPQIFAEMERDITSDLTASRDVCTILKDSRTPGNSSAVVLSEDCDTYLIDASVYINSIIISVSRAGIQLTASLLVRPGGKTVTLVLALLLSGMLLSVWPWASSTTVVLVLACLFEGAANVSFSEVLHITNELFPTFVRTSAVSLSALAGRAGSMVGNVLFPVLFDVYCASAFWIGTGTFVTAAIVSVFKPKPAFTPTPSTGLAKSIAQKSAQPKP